MAFSLARLKYDLAIVDPTTGKPTKAFLDFMNLQVLNPVESALRGQAQTIAELADIVAALQAVSQVAQAAQQAANQAQEAADQAGGGTATSGSATATVIPAPMTWSNGPQVDLTGVTAGNLTITGSGPQQNDSVSSDVTISGEFRVVEIVGITETTVFLGNFTVYAGMPATVVNQSAANVSTFSVAQASTGAVSYRMDARRTDGGPLVDVNLDLYLFARRS